MFSELKCRSEDKIIHKLIHLQIMLIESLFIKIIILDIFNNLY